MRNNNISRLLTIMLLAALIFTAIPANVIATDNYPNKSDGKTWSFSQTKYSNLLSTNTEYTFDSWYINPDLLETFDFNSTAQVNCWIYHEAYIGGYSDGTVRPLANITREEVAQIFYNLLAIPEKYETNINVFSDVTPDRWSNKAISTLASLRILNGYSDSTFMPGKEITRGEFIKIAVSFMNLEYINVSKYPYSDISNHWSLKYILTAEKAGWINGYSDGSFKPDQSISRAETIKIVNALSGRETGHIDRIESMNTWLDNTDESAWYYADVQIATNSYDMAPRN